MENLATSGQPFKRRPTLLTVLSILTLVYVGLSLISQLVFAFGGPMNEEKFKQLEVTHAKEKSELIKNKAPEYLMELTDNMYQIEIDMRSNYYLVVSVTILMYLIGLFAAIFMLQGKRIGFHMYIIYSLLSVASVYTYTAAKDVDMSIIVTGLIISGIFVLMYSRNLKWLR